jgi:aspartate carbamoyltransferase catalytic subunit
LTLTQRRLSIKHLTAIRNLDAETILSILEKSHFYSQNFNQTFQILNNKITANIFFENSTRTKFSFEVAAKKLGSHVLNFSPEASSLSKGESIYDTLKTFEMLNVDIAIVRHSDDSFIEKIKDQVQMQFVNAGAGKFEHPSQSLLDLYTIQKEFKKLDNLEVTICGDISTSRVASSNIMALSKFKTKVNLCGPSELLPTKEGLPPNVEICSLDEAIKTTDVLMFLRVQHERHEALEINPETYTLEYGLTDARISRMKKNAIIMHPGPVNRDVEIMGHLIEHPQSRIFNQIQNGIYTRMAILDWMVN